MNKVPQPIGEKMTASERQEHENNSPQTIASYSNTVENYLPSNTKPIPTLNK